MKSFITCLVKRIIKKESGDIWLLQGGFFSFCSYVVLAIWGKDVTYLAPIKMDFIKEKILEKKYMYLPWPQSFDVHQNLYVTNLLGCNWYNEECHKLLFCCLPLPTPHINDIRDINMSNISRYYMSTEENTKSAHLNTKPHHMIYWITIKLMTMLKFS